MCYDNPLFVMCYDNQFWSVVEWLSASLSTEYTQPNRVRFTVSEIFSCCCVSIALTTKGCWFEVDRLPSDIVKCSTSNRKVPGSRLVANSMTSNDGMASRALDYNIASAQLKYGSSVMTWLAG